MKKKSLAKGPNSITQHVDGNTHPNDALHMNSPKRPALRKSRHYDLLREAVDAGISFGIERWLKYRNQPLAAGDQAALEGQLTLELMNALCERFDVE